MQVALTYLYPLDDRATFKPFAERWVASYKKFDAGCEHQLVVGLCNGEPAQDDLDIFCGLGAQFATVNSTGIDCGCNQALAKLLCCDFAVFGTSRHYYHRPGYLKRLVEAREKCGRGLYGAVGSYEACPVELERGPSPHLRTVFYGLSPDDFCRYSFHINNRHEAHQFEAGERSLTNWFLDRGLPVKMVTWDGEHDMPEWRALKLKNIFRRGDQSDCLVWDKHSDAWRNADQHWKTMASISAGDKPVKAI